MLTKERVLDKLKEIEEPCMPLVNIVDMGLIYDVRIEDGNVEVIMTFTSKLCPVGFRLTQLVKNKIEKLDGVKSANVELTFNPPWTPNKLSEENRKKLGFI